MSDSLPPPPAKPKRPLRPLHGIPDPAPGGLTGLLVSSLIHLLIIVALLLPPLVARQLTAPEATGAGGPGPAGGGGGGTRGSGGEVTPERLRFLQVAPSPSAPTPPPEQKPVPTPTPVPPPPPTPEPEVTTKPAALEPASSLLSPTIPMPGSGGGSGNDGSGGNGPGSGGGVGSGVGTGRGSGVGPGTGGGGDQIFPPTVTNLAILPIPVPARVRPYKMVAQFDVDERGNAKLIGFNPSRDSGYNRKIREMLAEVRFRPATRADGTAVRDTAYIVAEAP